MGDVVTVHVPTSLNEAVDLMKENPTARLLAGGTDTMVEINFNKLTPIDVIALRRVTELRTIQIDDASATIGSGVPYKQLETGDIARLFPALAEAARTVGSPQIRAAGTLGGNLGTCSPAGDGLPVLSALDATVHVASHAGHRAIPVAEFMVGVKRNALLPGEIITAVTLPRTQGFQGYAKVGVRNAMVISVASACLVHDTSTASVRIALGAVGPTIVRCREAESWLKQQIDLGQALRVDDDVARRFAQLVASESRPITDHRSTAEYRRHAVAVLAARLLKRASS
jgi:CO/xanthine dehydrogenase FAD-binding subunit